MGPDQKTDPVYILKKNWSPAHELWNQAFSSNSKEKAEPAMLKVQAMKEMGKGYLMTLVACSDNKNTTIEQISNTIKAKFCANSIDIAYLLGFSIFNELEGINSFHFIHDFCSSKVENSFSIDISSSDSDNQCDYGVKIRNFYTMEISNNQSTQDQTKDNENDVSLDFISEDEDYNSDHIVNENEEVREYLYKLSKATTELSYLCQFMKWSQPTSTEQRSEINKILYSSTMEVMVRIKNKGFIITGECVGAVSKKQARRVGSLFILRKIYNKFPEVWAKFKKHRQQNEGFEQPMNANNEQIFKKAKVIDVGEISFFKEDKNVEELDAIGKQIYSYLDTLASYKNEFNVLIGKYKRITAPEMKKEKQDNLGLWPVEAIVQDNLDVLKYQAKQSSKKKAEEKCCRELLFQLYYKDPIRWRQFLEHKRNKNII